MIFRAVQALHRTNSWIGSSGSSGAVHQLNLYSTHCRSVCSYLLLNNTCHLLFAAPASAAVVLLLWFLVCCQRSRMAMTKELTAVFGEVKGEIKSDLREFQESFDKELCNELREIKVRLISTNHQYGEISENVFHCT